MAAAGTFEDWYQDVEPRLRRALVAACGPDQGREAAAGASAWAWEHRGRLGDLDHPVAYLFRVGQSQLRRRRTPWLHPSSAWTLAEAADLLGVRPTTVQSHLERGLAKLRSRLEVHADG